MRKILILAAYLAFSALYAQDSDPILFSVENNPVHVSEFKYIYEKNNADKADYSEKHLVEYLELYKKFKLKVHRARDLGLDTVKSLQKELEGYRKQLADSYLKDKEISERLIEEVAERFAEDREVSHIFITAEPKASPEIIAAAEQKINDIHSRLVANKGVGFGKMAQTMSQDKISAQKAGLLGFYTAPLPDGFYEFENAMYRTEVGQFSEPFKTKMGFHIIKVNEVRPARGEMEIAHILIRKKENAKERLIAKNKIDSVYNHLESGKTFETLSATYSDDKKTQGRGGYLGYFGVNQYERVFEDAAFSLTKDGQYTKPIETKIGFHIIKRISKRDTDNKERVKKRIEARINNNDRFAIAEEKLINDVKKQANFKEDRNELAKILPKLEDNFYSYKWDAPVFSQTSNPLFSLADKKYTLTDFGAYLKKNVRERLKFPKTKPHSEAIDELYAKYVKERVMAYEEANLEEKYPDFKALMREYREGILLFEITKQEVWDKASQDTVGLKNYYSENGFKYKWPERVNLTKVTITAPNQKKLVDAYKYATKKSEEKFMKKYKSDSAYDLAVEEVILDAESNELNGLKREKGAVTQLTQDNATGDFYFYDSNIPASPKSLNEAKGYVIADYQDFLESKWVKQLKTDYKFDLDENVFKGLIKK